MTIPREAANALLLVAVAVAGFLLLWGVGAVVEHYDWSKPQQCWQRAQPSHRGVVCETARQ